MKYPRLLKILNHTYRFKELPQLQKNQKILNPGNQTQHRWNLWWQWNILEKNPKILNPGNQSQHRWKISDNEIF